MKTRICIFSFIIYSVAFSTLIFAQNNTSYRYYSYDILKSIQEPEIGKGNIAIHQDLRINQLVNKHIDYNKELNGIQGFRIRIFSDLGNTARDKSQEMNAKFNEYFPGIPVYREYDSPYFKVYAGDYRTKNDALKDFVNIHKIFPAAFIVPGKINLPKIED